MNQGRGELAFMPSPESPRVECGNRLRPVLCDLWENSLTNPASHDYGAPKKLTNRKSVLLSLVLTFFLGPFGMLYSTVPGAIIMLILYVALGIPTLGWAIAGLHPIAMIWGAWAAHRANQ